ncbi:hypothetical protein [Desulfonatronospira sp.]|uniref:hypothetical protein n=1 Tax=Desulfonatronospira sp. TaxID=1962951 RepID=UPI0025BFBF39|nr:hypothetical protein [Desulfonatronospira sp.]
MAAISLTQPTLAQPATHAVFTKATWNSPWIDVSAFLHCLNLSWSTGESLGSAVFRYRFLPYLAPDSNLWVNRAPLVINPRSYVGVTVYGADGRPPLEWIGVWRRASLQSDQQRFTAVGVEWLLHNPCRNAPWLHNGTVRWAGRGLTFNQDNRPNRSQGKHTVHGESVYIFEPDPDAAAWWSTRDAVETTLALAAPLTPAWVPVWHWTPAALDQLPDWDRPQIETHDRQWVDLLRALVSRYQLTGWRVQPVTSGGQTTLGVQFFTFAEQPIPVYSRTGHVIGQIPTNPLADTLDVSTDASGAASLTTDAAHTVDQVVVVGDQREIVFSLRGRGDETLTSLWTIADQAAYAQGASGEGDWPDDRDEQDERQRTFRNHERYRHVWAHYGTPANWDQRAGGGYDDGSLKRPIAWEEDPNDAEGERFWVYPPLLQFAEQLPILTGFDIAGGTIANLAAQPDPPTYRGTRLGQPGEYVHEPVPLSGWIGIDEGEELPVDRYYPLDEVHRGADLDQVDEGRNRRWSADVRPLPDRPGVEIRVQGEEQLVLAGGLYIFTRDYIPGGADWQNIILTVGIHEPRDTIEFFPAEDQIEMLGDQVLRLRIDAPGYTRVDVRPNTVVGTDPADALLRRTAGGPLIDDRRVLRLIAQRAYAWHRTPRLSLALTTACVTGELAIGRRIVSLTDTHGTWPVNTVVSEITIQFPLGEGETPPLPKMTVATAYAELDYLPRAQ